MIENYFMLFIFLGSMLAVFLIACFIEWVFSTWLSWRDDKAMAERLQRWDGKP